MWLLLILLTAWAAGQDYVNAIYYLGKGVPTAYDFATFDLDRVSHILYAFADISGNQAKLEVTQSVEKGKPVLGGHLGALMQIKKQHRHVKVGLSILGDFGSMVITQQGRTEFVGSVVDLMAQLGFDFVDLDWEFPVRGFDRLGVRGNPDDANNMLLLLQEFHRQFKDKLAFRAFITMAIPVPDYYLSVYKFNEINQYIEYYNTMTYDFSGPFTDYAYHASNLYSPKPGILSLNTSVSSMLKAGIPANKLVVGMPAYAVVFRGCKEKGLFSTYDKELTSKVGDNGYAAVSALKWDKIEDNWDDTAKASWGWFPEQKMFITYESTRSATLKVDYIKERQLKGAMVWSLAQDFPISNNRSIVTATTNALQSLDVSQNNVNYPDSIYENVRVFSFSQSHPLLPSPLLSIGFSLIYSLII
ncbi:Chitinase 4 [Entomophthora muscae]|uniref:Chitinase 4 n=1 Tax=Entomophthora muscae TaxID=34485 RepID=A0ACC2TNT6_9FUNG|nr:Chitinase 4 [Entomophthora muscae]